MVNSKYVAVKKFKFEVLQLLHSASYLQTKNESDSLRVWLGCGFASYLSFSSKVFMMNFVQKRSWNECNRCQAERNRNRLTAYLFQALRMRRIEKHVTECINSLKFEEWMKSKLNTKWGRIVEKSAVVNSVGKTLAHLRFYSIKAMSKKKKLQFTKEQVAKLRKVNIVNCVRRFFELLNWSFESQKRTV